MAPYALYAHSSSTAAYEGFQTPVICWDMMWNPFYGRTPIFDVKICDMDAKSYGNHTSKKVLESAALRKKSKYDEACLERRLDFTPCCTLSTVWLTSMLAPLKSGLLAFSQLNGHGNIARWLALSALGCVLQ